MDIQVEKAKYLNGEIVIPSDKSISHRCALFSLLTGGKMSVSNFSQGEDCQISLKIIQELGAKVEKKSESEIVITAPKKLIPPTKALYCGNSGTTTRLIAGILAGQDFSSQLVGDESLSKRPMKRVITPLEMMSARINHNDFKLPIEFLPSKLDGIYYKSPLASAQVKSCVLLAGLNAHGETSFEEPYLSRNHTELMLQYLGAEITVNQTRTFIKKSKLYPRDIVVAGDISSAAFFIVAALIVPNSDILIKNVGINPTRTGIIDVLKKMGGNIKILNARTISNEQVADIRVKYSELKSTVIEGQVIPRLIDELPILVLAASQANGVTVIKDAQDLKNKETDRITATADVLNKLGADIEPTADGFIVNGKTILKGDVCVDSYNDHRIAMTLFVAGLITQKPVLIKNFEWVNISFPEFNQLMSKIKQ